MKRYLGILVIIAFVSSSSGCSWIKKMKDKVSVSDLKKVADMIDMDFGSGPDGPFDVTTTTSKDPKLIIQNETDRTITVKAQGPTNKTFVVASKKSKSGTVTSGSYHFIATASGVQGCEGVVELKGFKQYKWVFIIKRQ
jgi:hypothetical protein